jgi:hypothetical protein
LLWLLYQSYYGVCGRVNGRENGRNLAIILRNADARHPRLIVTIVDRAWLAQAIFAADSAERI